jgi:hypothetical protein
MWQLGKRCGAVRVPLVRRLALLAAAWMQSSSRPCGVHAGGATTDPRNVSNGHRIYPPLNGSVDQTTYQDQPQVTVLPDGSWCAVWTHGIGGTEGAGLGNRILSARSTDRGGSWSHPPLDVEPLALSSNQGALTHPWSWGSHRTPWHPVEDPSQLGPCSPDRESAIGNVPALVPGP